MSISSTLTGARAFSVCALPAWEAASTAPRTSDARRVPLKGAQLTSRFNTSAYLLVVLAPATAIVSCAGELVESSAARPVNCTPFSTA